MCDRTRHAYNRLALHGLASVEVKLTCYAAHVCFLTTEDRRPRTEERKPTFAGRTFRALLSWFRASDQSLSISPASPFVLSGRRNRTKWLYSTNAAFPLVLRPHQSTCSRNGRHSGAFDPPACSPHLNLSAILLSYLLMTLSNIQASEQLRVFHTD